MARPLKRRITDWLTLHIAIPIGFVVFTLIGWSTRKNLGGCHEKVLKSIEKGQRYVVAFWHGDIILIALERKRVLKRVAVHIMTSQSRDGALMERFIELCGMVPTRGSSSRGGAKALLEMIRKMEGGGLGGTAVDGPRGPRHHVNREGIVLLAQRTGLPLLPIVSHAQNKWVFNSWDRMEMPRPFSKTMLHFCEPLEVPRDADKAEIERLRLVVEERMRAAKNMEIRWDSE